MRKDTIQQVGFVVVSYAQVVIVCIDYQTVPGIFVALRHPGPRAGTHTELISVMRQKVTHIFIHFMFFIFSYGVWALDQVRDDSDFVAPAQTGSICQVRIVVLNANQYPHPEEE